MADQAIAALQQWLNNHGARLRVDGIIGPRTRDALRQFQTRAGLPATGVPDQGTMQAITRPPNPQMRPPPDVLGTGNTDIMPRQRPIMDVMNPTQPTGMMPPPRIRENIGYQAPAPQYGAPMGPPPDAMAPTGPGVDPQVQAYTQDINPGGSAAAGIDYPTLVRMGLTQGTRTAEARSRYGAPTEQGGMGMSGPRPPSVFEAPVGEAAEATPDMETASEDQGEGTPAASTATAAQRAAAIAQVRDALMKMQKPPSFQPTPDNPGYGLPGLPPNATFGGAVGDAFGAARDAFGNLIGMGRVFGMGR